MKQEIFLLVLSISVAATLQTFKARDVDTGRFIEPPYVLPNNTVIVKYHNDTIVVFNETLETGYYRCHNKTTVKDPNLFVIKNNGTGNLYIEKHYPVNSGNYTCEKVPPPFTTDDLRKISAISVLIFGIAYFMFKNNLTF
jgi:hypothetical protein